MTYKLEMTKSGVHIWLAGILIVLTPPYSVAFHTKYSSRHRCNKAKQISSYLFPSVNLTQSAGGCPSSPSRHLFV